MYTCVSVSRYAFKFIIQASARDRQHIFVVVDYGIITKKISRILLQRSFHLFKFRDYSNKFSWFQPHATTITYRTILPPSQLTLAFFNPHHHPRPPLNCLLHLYRYTLPLRILTPVLLIIHYSPSLSPRSSSYIYPSQFLFAPSRNNTLRENYVRRVRPGKYITHARAYDGGIYIVMRCAPVSR